MSGLVDPLAALLGLVRDAAREGAAQALAANATSSAAPNTPSPLADKRSCAHALGVSTATVDRLSRSGRIPFVIVGDVRRYDLAAVRAALDAHDAKPAPRPATSDPIPLRGVRLLGRGGR